MKVLTAAQMREIDRLTMERGIPGLVLMENAAHRVVEFLAEAFAPLESQRVVVFCGKGNNGGDGFAIARQLHTRGLAASLDVVMSCDASELTGDAAANYAMLRFTGCEVSREIAPRLRAATLIVDALLGTGVRGAASGRVAELIDEINHGFPAARVVAVDLPSGMQSDGGESEGEIARADYAVTFTAPKIAHVLPPNRDRLGQWHVAQIGTPPSMLEDDPALWLSLSEPSDFAGMLAPRAPAGHKGTYGHVLVMAGSQGKSGAAALCGLAALRAGAGLVTVATSADAMPLVAAHAPELMTELLPGNADGKDVIAIGPGIGRGEEAQALVRRVLNEYPQPVVADADALGAAVLPAPGLVRVLTPHPGEMARMTGLSVAQVQAHRVETARDYATAHRSIVVLKGQASVIATPEGNVWINPTGTPAMGKGGSGDTLTGIVAAFLAQFPEQPVDAVRAAVFLHGLAGEFAAAALHDKCVLATDLLQYLPEAMDECAVLSD